MKTASNFFYLLVFLILISSCGQDFYVPRQANLLVLENTKDLKTSLAYNHVQLAYSPYNNIGAKGQFSFINIDENRSNRNLLMGNVGIGVFKNKTVQPLRSKKTKLASHPKLCLIGAEIYGNFSYGTFNSQTKPGTFGFFGSSQGLRTFNTNLINPNISAQVYWQSRSYTFNFGTRAGLIYYYNTKGFGSYNQRDLNLAEDLVENRPFGLLEYDLQIAKGNDRLQTFAQVTWNQSFSRFLDPSSSFSFGLKVNIPKLIESIKGIKH